jgi:hypothetical protein
MRSFMLHHKLHHIVNVFLHRFVFMSYAPSSTRTRSSSSTSSSYKSTNKRKAPASPSTRSLSPPPVNDRISLCVGGTDFQTTMTTIAPSTFLTCLFSGE